MILRFIVHGKVASNNRTTRNFGKIGAVKSAQARGYQAKVYQIALATARREKWIMPAACFISIKAFNVRLDIDNVAKNVLDGMIGAIYEDDKVVTELAICKELDNDGERIEIRVEAVEPLVRPKKSRKKAVAA